MNEYFDYNGIPTPHSWFRAERLQSVFLEIEAAFDKIPPPSELTQGRANYLTEIGTGNAYVVAIPQAIPIYVAGQRFAVISNRLSTGQATLDVNGLGARAIRRADGTALAVGDLGPLFEVVYDGSVFLLTIPARGETALDSALNLSDLTNITAARASLGLGTMATRNNVDLGTTQVTGTTPIARGGTGATTVAAARSALGIGVPNLSNTSETSGVLPVSRGGTGETTASGERSRLGLGSLAQQNSISASGSQLTGVLPQSKGGLGATTAATQRAALGLGDMAQASRTEFAPIATPGTPGTYCLMKPVGAAATTLVNGDMVSGSNLRFSNVGDFSGNAAFGTWSCAGYSTNSVATMFLRIMQ